MERGQMGLLNFLMKKPKSEESINTYQNTVSDSAKEMSSENETSLQKIPAGWQSITDAFLLSYPGQDKPRQLSASPSRLEGGKHSLEGITIYDAGDYWHFVTYGLSDVYDQGTDTTSFGMEFTYKLKKYPDDNEEKVIIGTANLLKSLASLTREKGELFGPYEYVYTGQTEGVDVDQQSLLTGFICVPDDTVEKVQTPNEEVRFIQFVGVTDAELRSLTDSQSVQRLYSEIPDFITDYRRQSLR